MHSSIGPTIIENSDPHDAASYGILIIGRWIVNVYDRERHSLAAEAWLGIEHMSPSTAGSRERRLDPSNAFA
jgi:hypothetical protein